MEMSEKVTKMIDEVQRTHYPTDKDAYTKIYQYINQLRKHCELLYNITETLKQLDNVQSMMGYYMPKSLLYDQHGSRKIADHERNYQQLAREKKRLIATMVKLRSQLEQIYEAKKKPGGEAGI